MPLISNIPLEQLANYEISTTFQKASKCFSITDPEHNRFPQETLVLKGRKLGYFPQTCFYTLKDLVLVSLVSNANECESHCCK